MKLWISWFFSWLQHFILLWIISRYFSFKKTCLNSCMKFSRLCQFLLFTWYQLWASPINTASKFSKVSCLLIFYPLLNLNKLLKKIFGLSSVLFPNLTGQFNMIWKGVWAIPNGKSDARITCNSLSCMFSSLRLLFSLLWSSYSSTCAWVRLFAVVVIIVFLINFMGAGVGNLNVISSCSFSSVFTFSDLPSGFVFLSLSTFNWFSALGLTIFWALGASIILFCVLF